MKLLLSCMVSLTCTFSGVWALSNFFSIQKSKIWLRFFSVTIISVLQGLMCIFGIPILNTISMLAMIVLSTIICFRIPKISFLIYDFLIALICFIADAMSTLSLSFVTQKTISSAVAEDSLTISSCLRTCLLTFILCHIVFSMIRKKKSSFVWYESISYAILATGEIITANYIIENIANTHSGTFLVFFLTGCIVLDVYIVFAFYRVSAIREMEKKNALLQQQTDMQMAVYRDLEKRYQNSMTIIHDVKRHVNALEGLIQTENLTEAKQYEKSLYQQLDKLHPSFHCSNQLLSVILNHELLKAEQKGIQLNLNILYDKLDFLSDMDLTTIVSNLLDNAIEAVSELDKDRTVLFVIEEQMQCCMIHTENKYEKLSPNTENSFLSTKNGHAGIGLKNIEMTVKKYNGIWKATVENNSFVVSITIPIDSQPII